jgi:BirA family biotin operon repressor/biotin-[acetyl-CoA-carboxylase] ligase
MTAADPFNLAEVAAAIAATSFANHLHHVATTSSTNDLALSAAQSGARLGVWIADQQTSGRGRGNHTWHSAPCDGLYLSALISPAIPMQSAISLSFTAAIAVQSAICSVFGFHRPDQIDIRWPNDLLLNRRKCGGILIETASIPATLLQPSTLRYAVLGIGINVNHTVFPAELDAIATSLRRELPNLGAPGLASETWVHECLRREPLAAAILIALDAELRALTSNLAPRPSNLSQYSSWISGKRVRVETCDDGSSGYTGVTAGLDPQGFLCVHGDDGQLHTVLSGGLREP